MWSERVEIYDLPVTRELVAETTIRENCRNGKYNRHLVLDESWKNIRRNASIRRKGGEVSIEAAKRS